MSEKKTFIKPFYDRVILEVLTEQKVGGIYLTEDVQTSQRARVVAVGPGKFNIETGEYTHMHVKEGDVVIVNTKFANKIKLNRGDDRNLVMMKEDDIFGLEVEVSDDG